MNFLMEVQTKLKDYNKKNLNSWSSKTGLKAQYLIAILVGSKWMKNWNDS